MWQLAAGQQLRYRVWDDEGVVYNDLSGDTHLLGAPAMHLLLTLRAAPAGAPALAEALRAAIEVDPADDLHAAVAGLLAELQALALIEALP